MFGRSSPLDTYRLNFIDLPYLNGFNNVDDRTQAHPALVPGESTWTFLIFGQSLAASYCEGTYNKVSNRIFEINPASGGCYHSHLTNQMLGADHGFVVSNLNQAHWIRMADAMIAGADIQRVNFINEAVGGAHMAQYAASTWPNLGGIFRHRIRNAKRRLDDAGLTASAILFSLGTSDNSLNTSQADWTAQFLEFDAECRAQGFTTTPIIIAQESWDNVTTDANIRAAQAGLVNPAAFRFAGPDIDLILAADRYDGVHFAATGAALAATAWRTAINAVL